ncbi:MAG TPA: hypothetical protein VMZ74_11615 [Ramlibacter sp.]|nr:hypothetical protein [Ramlibacter sp.]
MDGIDPANQLAALIRVQVAALRQRQGGARAAPREAGTPADSPNDLSAVVAQRIRAIPGDDPERERKAFRLFLETVLLSELGETLVNDPSFAVMVDHVQQQMEGDPKLKEASLAAARELLKSADAG